MNSHLADDITQAGQPSVAPEHPLTTPSFVGFVTTQLFGAFNDNLFKQLMLLLVIPKVVEGARTEGIDLQGIATIVFGLPFVIFGGLAGFLSDRFSKRRVIVLSKFAEIVVMLGGLFAFLAVASIGFKGLWLVLFLMGTQSAFFGPGKYGILPEMMRPNQLARANGIVSMTTFIAIILGTSMAGWLKDSIVAPDAPQTIGAQSLWLGSLLCVAIAVIGTAASWLIRPVPAASPNLKLQPEHLLVPGSIVRLMKRDRPLMLALIASCVFWLIAGLTLQSVNSLCKVQLNMTDTRTSVTGAFISIGIAIGSVLAGFLSREDEGRRVIRIGMIGVVIACGLLSITLPGRGYLLGQYGLIFGLIFLGTMAAFFAIPIQVFLQSRPPSDLKGRMIAVMNQANFLAVVVSGVIYTLMDAVITAMDWPRSALFAGMAILFLPVAILYRMDHGTKPNEINDLAEPS